METLFDILWYAGLLAVPIGLTFASWRRYLALPPTERHPTHLVTIVLCLLSLASTTWVSFYLLILIDEHSAAVRSFLNHLSSGFVAFNVLLSAVLLIASFFTPRAVRSQLLLASAWMLATWTFASLVH